MERSAAAATASSSPSSPSLLAHVLVLVVAVHALAVPRACCCACWQREQTLDGGGVVLLRWNASAADGDDGLLVVEVSARTRGYVGLGLSPYTGTMAGADLVMAWVDDAGRGHARDYWADQNGSPTLDKTQDWTVLGAAENATHTVIRLARRLHTHHVMDVHIQPGPTRVIYSWSSADPDPDAGRKPHYHGKEQRGVAEVCLLAASSAPRRPAPRPAPLLAALLSALTVLSATNRGRS